MGDEAYVTIAVAIEVRTGHFVVNLIYFMLVHSWELHACTFMLLLHPEQCCTYKI
jgi:hypothetical protein